MSEFLKAVNEKIDSLTNQFASLTRQLDVVITENIALKKKVDNQFKNGLPKVAFVTDRHSSYFNIENLNLNK